MLRQFLILAAGGFSAVLIVAPAQAASLSHIRAERACARMGLNPSEAPFANCVASLEQSVGAAPSSPDTRPVIPEAYYYRRGDQLSSIHRACAEMGARPGSQQYVSCVGNLNMTINDANRVGTD